LIQDAPLKDASESQLRAAISENLYDLFRAMAKLPSGELVESAANYYHIAFPLNPWKATLLDCRLWLKRLSPQGPGW
jgi:hypothetical protein